MAAKYRRKLNLRRFFADQRGKAWIGQYFVNRTNTIRPLGVTGWCLMPRKAGMRNEKGAQNR
jgi:hypothetical protein